MKTALYIEDGTLQLVITPESKFERDALAVFTDSPMEAKLFSGAFYDSRGGWVKQCEYNCHAGDFTNPGRDQSLIIRAGKRDEGERQQDFKETGDPVA